MRRITSGGGGIYIYVGLQAGLGTNCKNPTPASGTCSCSPTRRIPSEPGDYRDARSTRWSPQGATVSVIGLGTEADKDADLLKDIAARGKGRIFFNADANDAAGLVRAGNGGAWRARRS